MTGGVSTCPSCGESIPDPSIANVGAPPRVRFAIARVVYAGFWLRVVAYTIDSLLIGILAGFVILRPLMDRAGISLDNPWVLVTANRAARCWPLTSLVMAAGWLYWALLESSAWQGNARARRCLGLRVTDLEGRRISFARASGRYFGKLFSQLILSDRISDGRLHGKKAGPARHDRRMPGREEPLAIFDELW